jgi:hypothetical protein
LTNKIKIKLPADALEQLKKYVVKHQKELLGNITLGNMDSILDFPPAE